LRVVRELIKLQVTRRIRLALFELNVALLTLQVLSFDGVMAYRARLPSLAISAAPGKRLPRTDQLKN
jgi:hypothetical protein